MCGGVGETHRFDEFESLHRQASGEVWTPPLHLGVEVDRRIGDNKTRQQETAHDSVTGWRRHDTDTRTRRGLARHGPPKMDTGPT